MFEDAFDEVGFLVVFDFGVDVLGADYNSRVS